MAKKWLIFLGVLVIGAVAFYLVYTYVYNKPHKDYAALPAEATLTAQALYEAFTQDQESAQSAFLGKMVEVNGLVDAIEYLDDQPIAVFHFGEGLFGPEGVRCTFIDAAAAGDIQVGDMVSLKGYCTGFTGEDVILEHCTLTP